jgi:hypothetical protein
MMVSNLVEKKGSADFNKILKQVLWRVLMYVLKEIYVISLVLHTECIFQFEC